MQNWMRNSQYKSAINDIINLIISLEVDIGTKYKKYIKYSPELVGFKKYGPFLMFITYFAEICDKLNMKMKIVSRHVGSLTCWNVFTIC
jgi:hypothetical protein